MPKVITRSQSIQPPEVVDPVGGKGRTRNAVNTIVEGKVYQRGQILTWQREKKYAMLRDLGIRTVVNFWPKIDPDLGEAGMNYLHFPAVQSEQMLDARIETAARFVAQLCEEGPALILCEAGMTRSVYFCVLVTSILLDLSLAEAKDYVLGQVRRTSLKGFMLRRLQAGWSTKKATA